MSDKFCDEVINYLADHEQKHHLFREGFIEALHYVGLLSDEEMVDLLEWVLGGQFTPEVRERFVESILKALRSLQMEGTKKEV